MNKIVLVTLSLTIGLVSIAYGQMPTMDEMKKQTCETEIQGEWINGKCMVDRNALELKQQLSNSKRELQTQQKGLEPLLNYCFEHADRPNPLQDLIDKGLMPTNMTGITCLKVSQMNADIQNQILDLENKINEISIK